VRQWGKNRPFTTEQRRRGICSYYLPTPKKGGVPRDARPLLIFILTEAKTNADYRRSKGRPEMRAPCQHCQTLYSKKPIRVMGKNTKGASPSGQTAEGPPVIMDCLSRKEVERIGTTKIERTRVRNGNLIPGRRGI